ncbi:MAG: hypothetical protein ACKOAD_06565 [Gammaproteobacteria bacterium]
MEIQESLLKEEEKETNNSSQKVGNLEKESPVKLERGPPVFDGKLPKTSVKPPDLSVGI